MVTDTHCLLYASNYAATEQQVSMARGWVRSTADRFVDNEALYDLSVCASELADNARKHGAGSVISVSLYLTDKAVRLEVTNDCTGDTVPHVTDNRLAVDGHGLQIVSKLAVRWGCEVNDEHDQIVWCEFPRAH
jgi:anti-sigma regulatory factor (Ser/Thr protein kinase)